jgi:hypothetical protein
VVLANLPQVISANDLVTLYQAYLLAFNQPPFTTKKYLGLNNGYVCVFNYQGGL